MNKEIIWKTENGVKDEKISCNYLTYEAPTKYNWIVNNLQFTNTASAQGINNLNSSENLLSVPLYIIVIIFLLFTVTMSLIYMYHWIKFSLNDPFIRNFSIFYFIGLSFLLIPLIFNLI